MSFEIEARACRMGEVVSLPARNEDAPEAVEVEVSFSSESPYKRVRWNKRKERAEPYLEVLGHADGEADLSILSQGAPVLKDHRNEIDSQVGRVGRAWIEGGFGRAVLRFAQGPDGAALAARVLSGDIANISVGYEVLEAREDGTCDGLPLVRVTRWVAREISWVAVPADASVGYGRSDNSAPVLTIEQPQNEESDMDENDIQTPPAATETRAAKPAAPSVEDALRNERIRSEEIGAIGAQFDVPADLVRKAQKEGTSVDAFRASVLDHMQTTQATQTRARASLIGMEDRDKDKFSILRLVRFMADPSERNAKSAGFEIELSRAAAETKRSGRTDLALPADVLLDDRFATRALNTGAASEGGALVPVDHLAGSFIDLLRNRLALADAGVTVLSGLTGDVDIPKQTGGATAYWVGEDVDGTPSQLATGVVSLSPHTMALATEITRRMLIQSSPDIEALVRMDLIKKAALELDSVALNGSTSADAPEGLRDLILGNAVDWASAGAPTWEEMVDLETRIEEGADESAMRYIFNRKTAGKLKTTKKDEGSGEFVLRSGEVNDYPVTRSGQAADFEAFFGSWSNLVIGLWSGLDLEVDKATKAASGGLVLRGFQDVDVALRHAGAFAMSKNGA